MIQQNELRIGNKLTDQYDRVLSVYEIRPIGIRCLYKGQQNTEIDGVRNGLFTFEDLHPIELSPEILEKIEEATKVGGRGDYWINGVRIVLSSLDIWRYDNGAVMVENMPQIKYLHQLMNLYYALTGNELTINL